MQKFLLLLNVIQRTSPGIWTLCVHKTCTVQVVHSTYSVVVCTVVELAEYCSMYNQQARHSFDVFFLTPIFSLFQFPKYPFLQFKGVRLNCHVIWQHPSMATKWDLFCGSKMTPAFQFTRKSFLFFKFIRFDWYSKYACLSKYVFLLSWITVRIFLKTGIFFEDKVPIVVSNKILTYLVFNQFFDPINM